MNEYLLDWVCWGLVTVVWLVGWVHNRIRVPVQRRPHKFCFLMWKLVGAAGVLVWALTHRWWEQLTYHAAWMGAIGSVLLIISTVFAIWSRVVLGRMWAGDAEIKEGHQLRTDGPYSITRHPIYTALLGVVFGETLMHGFGSWLFFLAGVFLVFLWKIRIEEALLIETFGDEYVAFRGRTPALFPTIRSLHGSATRRHSS